jgi:hypothetical protein
MEALKRSLEARKPPAVAEEAEQPRVAKKPRKVKSA